MYELKKTSDNTFGGKGSIYYQVENYDGDVEKLKQFVKELNENANFWISWHIINEKTGLLEKEIDPLD